MLFPDSFIEPHVSHRQPVVASNIPTNSASSIKKVRFVSLILSVFIMFSGIMSTTAYRSASVHRIRNSIKSTQTKSRFMQSPFHVSKLFASSSKDWPVSRVRSAFVKYFEEKHEHVNYKSSPCVPLHDPTLLFTNAGMNQFKPIFIGTVDPLSPLSSLKRAVNSQKCIRAGGKHNDLEDVGKDTYHHTFFEMLGTWSFGDYFKKEAIDMAYDILVNTYHLDPNRIYASYFGGDESMGLPCDTEARDYWLKYLPKERVLPFDRKANFWEMGDTGPCGPCSEIHYDRIGGRDASSLVNADDPNVIEIWNLVFIQFNREPDGSLRPLPNKHIDTGMGLERLTSILQTKPSNYDTDVFDPIFKAISASTGAESYTGLLGKEDAKQNYRDTAYRVVADHIRTLTFSITDGAVPSNEGRGYVLRRILRRAVRYGMQTLGAKAGFLSSLVPTVVHHFSDAFPELRDKEGFVISIIREEEEAFATLLEKGVKYFQEVADDAKKQGTTVISGDKAFFLYDTLGFPIDLTQIMAGEQGLTVDTKSFESAMLQQKERSRQATKLKRLAGRTPLSLGAEQVAFLQQNLQAPTTQDSKKYQRIPSFPGKVVGVYTSRGFVTHGAKEDVSRYVEPTDSIGLVLAETPFYAESGGQIADTGRITIEYGDDKQRIVLDVVDVQSYGGYILHTCVLADDESQQQETLSEFLKHYQKGASTISTTAEVDYQRRSRIAPNHSMTHVLHWALQSIFASSAASDASSSMKIEQRGSLVSDEKLRFDFSAPRALTSSEIDTMENQVNDVIRKRLPVHNEVVKLADAQGIAGVRAVFGEVYPDPVRVLSIGPAISALLENPKDATAWGQYSIEFCGGTHVSNTGDAEAFAIIEETAVAKGIRRITAVTGLDAQQTITRSQTFLSSIVEFERDLVALAAAAVSASSEQDISLFESRLSRFRSELDTQILRQVTKTQAREQLDGLQRQLLTCKNKVVAQKVEVLLEKVITDAKERVLKGETTAVFTLPLSSDAKMMKRTVDELKKAVPTLSFLCIATGDPEKIPVFALVTETCTETSGLKANEWVTATVQAFQGRGGGKSNNAQGTVVLNPTNTQNQSIENVLRQMQGSSTEYARKTSLVPK